MALRSSTIVRSCAVVALLAAGVAACHLLIPAGEDTPFRADANTPNGPGDAGDAGLDPCGPIPDKPLALDQPSGPPIVFAAIKWSIDPSADAGDESLCTSRGFNLDNLFTHGDPRCEVDRACAPRPEAETSRVWPCDGPNGEDNALRDVYRRILSQAAAAERVREYDYNQAIQAGLSTSLFELHDYSGQRDDEKVVVHLYGSVGIEGIDASVTNLADVPKLEKIRDGGQDFAWIVNEDSLDYPDGGRLQSAKVRVDGFVRDYLLVIPRAGIVPLPFVFGGRPVQANTATISGLIVPPSNGFPRYRLTHVRVGMRLPSREILSVMASTKNLLQTWLQFCDPDSREPYKTFVREFICAYVDLPAEGQRTDLGSACSDLSGTVHAEYVGSRLSRIDGGFMAVGKPTGLVSRGPCVDDDAGTEWCDDCTWDAAS